MVRVSLVGLLIWVLTNGIMEEATSCSINFKKIGCYKDSLADPRPFGELLSTDRDIDSDKFSGKTIRWGDWDRWLEEVVCRCASNASERSYSYFGIQFYGECWSGEDSLVSFDRHGKSTDCVSTGYSECEDEAHVPCVGEQEANFVYKIVPNPKETACSTKFEKVGCFDDGLSEPRRFPFMLMTDRDPHSPKFSGIRLSWTKWDEYIRGLACRCAKKALDKEYTYFSLQNYGECWSGPTTPYPSTTSRHSEICIGKGLEICEDIHEVCVGLPKSSFVFRLKDA